MTLLDHQLDRRMAVEEALAVPLRTGKWSDIRRQLRAAQKNGVQYVTDGQDLDETQAGADDEGRPDEPVIDPPEEEDE